MRKILLMLSAVMLSAVASVAGTITVISPNGGENLVMGTTTPILYGRSGITNTVKIELWKDGSYIGIIANNQPANGIYSWRVGTYANRVVSTGGGYRIKVRENNTRAVDGSDQTFFIRPRGWQPPQNRPINIYMPAENAVFQVGEICLIKWRTPDGVEGSNDSVMLTLWKPRQSRFRPIGHLINQPGENQFRWTIMREHIWEPGNYRICINKDNQAVKLAEGPLVRIRLSDNNASQSAGGSSTAQNPQNDLEIGPVTPDCITGRRVSHYGGGAAVYDFDKYRFTVNLKIRNNSWNPNNEPKPVIHRVPCSFKIYFRNYLVNGQRNTDTQWYHLSGRNYRNSGWLEVGPFESKLRGEWTTCAVSFSCFMMELGEQEESNTFREYYILFELNPAASINDPNPGNNSIRSSRFRQPNLGNATVN